MKKLYFIRHCKATGQDEKAPLTAEGFEQAKALVSFFDDKKVDKIISSQYLRAQQTADPLARNKCISITTDKRLGERVLSNTNLPDWFKQLQKTFIDFEHTLPGGESSRQATGRGVQLIRELLNRQERNIVLVTHGNLMALLLKYFDDSFGFQEWANLSNPDVYEVMIDETVHTSPKRIWFS